MIGILEDEDEHEDDSWRRLYLRCGRTVRTGGRALVRKDRQLAYTQVFHLKLIDLEMVQVNSLYQHLPDNKAPDY